MPIKIVIFVFIFFHILPHYSTCFQDEEKYFDIDSQDEHQDPIGDFIRKHKPSTKPSGLEEDRNETSDPDVLETYEKLSPTMHPHSIFGNEHGPDSDSSKRPIGLIGYEGLLSSDPIVDLIRTGSLIKRPFAMISSQKITVKEENEDLSLIMWRFFRRWLLS